MSRQLDLEETFFQKNTVYHIRVTDPNVDKFKTFKGFEDYEYLIVSDEGLDGTAKRHQHILVAGYKITSSELRKKIKELYPELVPGNAGHSIKEARNKRQLLKYVLKDEEEPQHKGFSKAFMERFKMLAYNIDHLKKNLEMLQERLSLREITLPQYVREYIKLKAHYNQPLYPRHIEAHVRAVGIKNNLIELDSIASGIIRNLEIY